MGSRGGWLADSTPIEAHITGKPPFSQEPRHRAIVRASRPAGAEHTLRNPCYALRLNDKPKIDTSKLKSNHYRLTHSSTPVLPPLNAGSK